MEDWLRTHLTFANVGVVVAIVLAASGFAVAAIPSGGVIHGCFAKRTGALRVIGSRKHCARGEQALSWNQQGKPGLPGQQGKPGLPGQQGAQGVPGSDAQFNGAGRRGRSDRRLPRAADQGRRSDRGQGRRKQPHGQ
jgi:hypothetical protein